MRRVYLLILVLAATAAGASLAGWAPHAAGGAAPAPVETPQRPAQQGCVDDVSVTVYGIYEGVDYRALADPPDYRDGDDIRIAYVVTNSSCQDVTLTVALTGSVSKATIHDADGSTAPCLNGCTIPAGPPEYGTVQWDLSKHPNATGEKVVATVTIDAPSDFSDSDTSNNSATSTQAINIVNEEPDPSPDIAVKSVKASKTTVVIGEAADFTVVVKNDGDADAETDTTVTLHLGDGTDELDSDTVSLLADGPDKTVTLSWDTNGAKAGKHTLRALAQTEGDGNADNDSATVTVTLLEPSVDVAVKSVTASATEALVGDPITFTVTLENSGNAVAPWPEVSLFDPNAADAAPLASQTADTSIAAGGEITVEILWDTSETAAGERNLRVRAQTERDDNPDNDSASVAVTLIAPVDVAISIAETWAETAIAGNSVSVPFTLTNLSEHDAGEVTVSLYVTPEGEERGDREPTATTTESTVAAGDAATGTIDWDTADVAVGRYDLEVVIQTIGDTDATNNAASASIEIRNWILLKNVSPTSAAAVSGDTVEFTAQVENVGTGELTGVTVGLYESENDDALADVDFASIAAGGTADATVRWATAGRDAGQVELFVTVVADGQAGDEGDKQSVNVTIRNPIELLSATPASADNIAGTSVSINVEVLNESDVAVTDVEVKLDVVEDCENEDDEEKEQKIGCATIAAIPAGEKGVAVLEWDTAGVAAGQHELKVIASMDNYSADDNDERSLTISLREPVMDVALTAANLNRSVAAVGQTLDVTATITNNGEVPVAVPVALYLEAGDQGTAAAATATSPLIKPGSSEDVTLPWDTTDETVGTHTLRVSAELPEDTTDGDNTRTLTAELFASALEGDDAPESCVEDVRASVNEVRDITGQQRSPPDYQVGEYLRLSYIIYNYSCAADVQVSIAMTHDGDDEDIDGGGALCFSACRIPYGGKAEGEVAWTIPTSPASDRPVSAALTVEGPDGFTDVNPANDTSDAPMNIVHPNDVVLRLGEERGNKVSTRRQLAGLDFGTVNVRLVSAVPTRTNLPFAAETVEVAVEVANDGTTTEPAAVRFLWKQQELSSHTVVIPAGQTKLQSLHVPITELPPGAHTIEVQLSAAVDQSPGNNKATVAITRLAPLVNVAVSIIAVSPEVLMLGGEAIIALTAQNNSDVPLALYLELYLDDEPQAPAKQSFGELPATAQLKKEITWNLPDSGKHLGPRVLKLALTSAEYGRVAEISKDVTLHINAEILRIKASPTETAMRGEEVAIEVEVQNNGPATVNVPVTLHFPSETKNPETRRPPVLAESTETARFTWKTRDYAVDDHMLTATVPEQHNIATGKKSMELPFRLTPLAVTATIVDFWVYPETPSVGEPVSISVMVRNDGPVATRIPVTLHFPLGGRQPETRKPHVHSGQTETETFEWRTGNYPPGTHRFRIQVAAVGNPVEYLDVKLLPAVENVAIADMGTYPVATALVGELVEVWVDVRNDGPVALHVPVQLTFPSAAKRPETKSPRVDPGETARVWFEWKTSNYEPGIHTLSAAILLDNNATFGPTTDEIRFALTPLIINATILDIAVSPEAPRIGEAVTITVKVRNDGPVAARIPVTLRFPPGGRQPETRSHRIDPGAPGEVSFTWRTGRYTPGRHDFWVEVPSDPPISRQFTVELLPPIVNVAILGMGSDPAEFAIRGQHVKIWVDVINNGPSALNVPVQLAFPSDEKQPERKSTRVEPGRTARLEFTWKTTNYAVGDHLLTATLLADYNITELDASDTIQIALVPAQLMASIIDISWNPESPAVGEPVRITVTVRNDGLIAANIPVTLYFPSADKQPETRSLRIDPGATGEVSFTWRTGRYEPGRHDFRVEVPNDPPISRQFTVELLPPTVNVAIVGISSDPAETAFKGQAVKIWVDVINNGPSALNVPVQLAFPSSDKQPERKSTRVEPGRTARVEFTWKTSNYDLGIHALTATLQAEYNITQLETSATIQIRLVSPQLAASIVDISWHPASPVVGEPVRIVVTVRNDGLIAANIPVTLHFPSGGRQPETRSPRVDPGHTGTATFDWPTGNFAVGTHQFRVELVDVDAPDQRFTIDLLPTVENVAIVGMGTYPVETAIVGEPVEVWVDVRNDGPVAVKVPVQLAFPSDEKKPEQDSERIQPGEIARYSFTWRTSNYEPGIHALSAAILLDNNVTLGPTAEEIRFALTPLIINATILDIAVSPEAPRIGEPAIITVKVRNDGRIAANIPVTLHYPSDEKQPETRRPRVDVGDIGEAVFMWRTGRYTPGIHEFRVEVPSDPPLSRQFTVELLPPTVNVAIVGISSDPAETAFKGQAVKIWVDVINNGPSALNVPVQLAFPSSDKQPERKSTRVEPGRTARVEFTWKTSNYDLGIHALTATLQAEYNITQLETSATIQIRLVSPQLAASIVDISWHPASPVVGEPVSITVTVRNNGSVAANIPVTLYFPSGDKRPETKRPRVAPGTVGTASFTWRTSRYEPGDHVFRVQIPGVGGAFRTFEIELRPPEVDFAVVSFQAPDPLHPIVKGDWVEITVVLQNQGPYAGRGTVYLLNGANPDAMYEQAASLEPGEFREVEFTWKTLRYPVGEYDLLVWVDAEHDADPGNDHSDPARVRLLTNRDITVGFGNVARPAVFAEATSEAALRAAPWYSNDIQIAGVDRFPIDRTMGPASGPPMGVSPQPTGGNYDPARMYWRWRSAQVSPWECARYQQAIGKSLPRAVVCPKAPALVR